MRGIEREAHLSERPARGRSSWSTATNDWGHTSRSREADLARIVVIAIAAIVLLPVVLMLLLAPMMGFGMMGWGSMIGWDGAGMGGWTPWWGIGILVVWLVVLVGVGYGAYRLVGRHAPSSRDGDPALEELRLAYARGDLTDEEYESRRQALQREK